MVDVARTLRVRLSVRSALALVFALGLTFLFLEIAHDAERVIAWVLSAAAIAALVYPAVEWLAHFRFIPRGVAVLLTALLMLGAIGFAGYKIVNDVSDAMSSLQQAAPQRAGELESNSEFFREIKLKERVTHLVDAIPKRLAGGEAPQVIESAASQSVAFLAGFILTVGEKSLFLSLVLTMIVCLILGMGIPTIPNYIITSSIAAPALLKLGVPLIVSHMFVFYFGIMADLTPPVALAAFAAASISRASPMQTGVKATQIAIAGFVVPFMAIYAPELMMQGDAGWIAVVYVTVKAIVAILLWGAAAVGYLRVPLSAIERVLAALAACLLVAAVPLTDQAGFVLGFAIIGLNVWRARRPSKANTAAT